MLDDELREQLADWVRPIQHLAIPDVAVLRRRARRRRARRAGAAAAVTAVVAAIAVAVVASLPGSGRPASSRPQPGSSASWRAAPGSWTRGTWQPAGPLPAAAASPAQAPYFVTIHGAAAVVTDAYTGHVTATVKPSAAARFAGVAAAGDDRTFILAASAAGTVTFDELRLRPGGQLASVVRLFSVPMPVVPAFAVSPDASLLAYATVTGLEVVRLAAQTARTWPAAGGELSSLSWGGDKTLAFEWSAVSPVATVQPAGAGVRLLDITATGRLLPASRLLIGYCPSSQLCTGGPVITADGATVFATNLVLSATIRSRVEEYSARTGRPLAAVTPLADVANGGGAACQPLWADPSGAQLTVFCGTTGVVADGRFSPVELHLPRGILNSAGQDFAW
jgi:hypothetical protein